MDVDLGMPVLGGLEVAPRPAQYRLDWGRTYSLSVFNFALACCAVEFVAATMGRQDFVRLGLAPASPDVPTVELMVVSGTVTDKMAEAVLKVYEALPEPRYVISFGSCANSGGPYWDSYCVTKGVDQLLPVDVYVPGCPPRPEALLQGIRLLQERIDGGPVPSRPAGAASVTRGLVPPPAGELP